jgi:ppGpp synthetase/RelA/SpoT-type nucleotidyltranferase
LAHGIHAAIGIGDDMSWNLPPAKLPKKEEFLLAFAISPETYQAGGVDWNDLREVYADYLNWFPSLDAEGKACSSKLQSHKFIRAVHSRPKDPNHLIEKVIIRSAKQRSPYVTKENYLRKVTDLLGLRALHVFKEEWPEIDKFIRAEFDVEGTPEAKLREGDPQEVIKMYKDQGCAIDHTGGYRSVHYSISVRCRRNDIMAELQVRTLLEEAWGEASHRIDYPIPSETPLVGQYVSLMSDLCCFSDEIASAARILKEHELLAGRPGKQARARREELWAAFQAKTDYLCNHSPSVARVAIPPRQIPTALAHKVLRGRKSM